MKRRNKILCLVLLFVVMFGGAFMSPFITHNNIDAVETPIRPNSRFAVAAVAALDAVGPNENNITEADGSTIDAYGDDLFAGNRFTYIMCVNASDADGYADIDVISASLQSTGDVNVTTFIWTRTGANTVVESTGAANVILGTWSNVTGANDVDIMIPFTIEWDFGAVTDLDYNVTLDEGGTPVATRETNLNLDVIATLTMSDSTMFAFNDYLNGAPFGTIAVTYHYAGYTTLYPLDAQTDFHVSMAAVPIENIGARTWVSTGYADATGIANFNDIVAPETNTRQQLTFTMLAVDNGDGATGTNLATTATYTDTVWIDPNAPEHPTDADTGPIIGADIFGTAEGVLLIGGATIVILAGGYYSYSKKSTSTPRRRTTKRKSTKRKKRKR